MSYKTLGKLLEVAGILVIIFIFISPLLGIGNPHLYSVKKIAVAIFGLVAFITGLFLSLQKKPAA